MYVLACALCVLDVSPHSAKLSCVSHVICQDEEQIKLQQRKRDYYLLLVGFGVLNMFFFGYILSRLSSTAAVQERGWAGAVRNFFSG